MMDSLWVAILAPCLRSFSLLIALRIMEVWLWVHTLALDREARAAKREERRAFYHDFVEELKDDGYAPPDIGPHVLLDVLRGIPADVTDALRSLGRRSARYAREQLGGAEFWLALLAVFAIWELRRIPRFKGMAEPSLLWPLDWAVVGLCVVMLALYGGALKRAPAEVAKWQPLPKG